MKMKDYVGRHVRLLRRIETQGGQVFPEGEVMRVSGHWRGKLYLDRLTKRDDGTKAGVRHVARSSVDLLPEDPKALVQAAAAAAMMMANEYGYTIEMGSWGFKVTPCE